MYDTQPTIDSPLKCHQILSGRHNFRTVVMVIHGATSLRAQKADPNTYRNRHACCDFRRVHPPTTAPGKIGGEILASLLAKLCRKYSRLQMTAMARNTLGLLSHLKTVLYTQPVAEWPTGDTNLYAPDLTKKHVFSVIYFERLRSRPRSRTSGPKTVSKNPAGMKKVAILGNPLVSYPTMYGEARIAIAEIA
jgi:hypothetical protein